MGLSKWEAKFWIGAAAVLPIAPLLALQGRLTRWKVGVIPGAEGETAGVSGSGDAEPAKLFVIGESTVAGLGARTHNEALAGQFAKQLSERIRRPVRWNVLGKNGVTARRTIDELLPLMPEEKFDYILIGLGGNDVMKLSSPTRWRRDMIELLSRIREKQPDATIFLTNCPMIIMSPVIPQPIKALLWRLSQMHNANAMEFSQAMPRVYYYRQPAMVKLEGFFADGIHPSEQGYADWSEAMLKFFDENFEWQNYGKI